MTLSTRLWRNFRWLLLRAVAPRGPHSRWILAIGVVAIVLWQLSFSREERHLDSEYTITAASGMHNDRNFVYFFWYEGLFPVASTTQYIPCTYRCMSALENDAPTMSLSKADADMFIRAHPDTLVQDITWTWNAGDRGKIFLFMIDTWLKGAPWKPSVKPAHRMVFTLSLVLLFGTMWRARRAALGMLLVIFLGSNPLQLYEVHQNENVFGWNISTAILMLAIHVPLLVGRVRWRPALLWPIGTGILLASIRTIRSEPIPILAALVFAYAQVVFSNISEGRKRWGMRAALVGLFFVAFAGTGRLWSQYWVYKQEQAEFFVRAVGGHPYPGPMRMYHHFWHTIWCGLGDFGEDKGYKWEDVTALAYAKPILEQRYHQYVPNATFGVPPMTYDEYWDAQRGFYKRLPYDTPHYDDIVRDKVLGDIRSDPKWYARILWKRAKRVFGEPTPVRIAWWDGWHTVLKSSPRAGKLFAVLLAFAFAARVRFMRNLLLFTLPTCATALVVYSDRGVAWYGIFHIIAAALWIMVAWAGVESVIKWQRRAFPDDDEQGAAA